jgi:1-acyl-sn-glycerol-3-phosphate acyltransferase
VAIEVVLFVVATLLLPLLLLAALATDLVLWIRRRKPWMAVRLLGMAWWFLFGEMRNLPWMLGIWIGSGGPWGHGSLRRRRWVYRLRIHWMRSILAGLRVLFGMKIEVDGLDEAGPGPVLIFMRHASIIDNTLPDALAGHAHGMGLRFVIKRELQALPSIDIAGRWVPTSFVRRASKDPEAELAVLRQLATEFGPPSTEGILIYPEGTRCTEAKLKRAKEIIAERQPEIAHLANGLNHVLPPRRGGPLAHLDATAGTDVVFCAHVGLDGFERVSDIWGGGLVGTPVRVKFWRCPAAEVPAAEAERTAWLYREWQRVDDWIGAQIAAGSTV